VRENLTHGLMRRGWKHTCSLYYGVDACIKTYSLEDENASVFYSTILTTKGGFSSETFMPAPKTAGTKGNENPAR